jgi:type I restriction enzyme S subunit
VSRIDELITKLCPDGVEFRMLGEVVSNLDSQRRPVTRSDRRAGEFPYYGANGIQDYVDDYLFDGTFLLVGEDGSVVQRDGSPVVHWASGKIWVNNHAHVLTARTGAIELRYLYFYLQTIDVTPYVTASSQPKLNQANLNRIPVAVPPVEVQREIVNVLDLFRSLEAELGAELEARQLQYDHYRNAFLAFPEGAEVRWARLPEISTNLDSQRKPVTKSARVAGQIPYYGASGIVDYVSDYIFDGDYLLVSEDGANLLARSTPIAFSISGKTWVNNHAHVLKFSTYAERRFVEIYLNSIDLSPFVTGGAQPKLNQANLNKIPIPTPPVREQERIVTILDKLDALVNDLSIGLPAELTARRKQYEHYRDRLLTFEALGA